MKKTYKIKEIFYTLQGEGAQSGRPAIFCRFSKCNLWNGKEEDRARSACSFCDTDILGTDGRNGGEYISALDLATTVSNLWPNKNGKPFVVCTGGEPALQVDEDLIENFHQLGFEVAIETNGTLPLPLGIDWICCSPKGSSKVVIKYCNELKLVFPQRDAMPENFSHIKADFYYLTPMAEPLPLEYIYPNKDRATQDAVRFCLDNPKWRLNLQTHKVLNIS
jgi:7-carboxy-7-deazaguanine synthase (Cx14CxxC type)